MKKILSLLLVLVLVFSVVACSSKEEPKKEDPKKEEKKEEPKKEEEKKEEEKKEETKKEDSKKEEVDVEMIGSGIIFKNFEGKEVKLSDYKGKKIYIEFMATWWPACTAGLGEAEKISASDRDYEVLYVVSTGVGRELNEADFKKWASDLEYKNIKFFTVDGDVALKEFGVRAFPTNVIINTKGEVVLNQPGVVKMEQIQDFMSKVE